MEEKKVQDLKLDLTKIKNASSEIDTSIIAAAIEKSKKEMPLDRKKEKKSERFRFAESSKIPLPSKGKFYKTEDEDIKNGYIKLYPMTMREEEILSTPRYIMDGTATIMALNNCIESDIDAEDLLMYDYTYLLFYLRKISFGDSYSFNLTCSNCGHEFRDGFNISEIKFEELPDDFKEPYRIDLPVSKYTVVLTMPRVRHIREFENKQDKMTVKQKQEYSGISDLFSIRTAAIIDNKGEAVPKEYWVEFFKSLTAKDRAVLTKNAVIESGVNKVMDNIVCPNCETKIGGSIPVTDEFFRFGSE